MDNQNYLQRKNPNSTEKFDVRVTSNYQSITRKFPIKEKLLEMIDSSKKTKENLNMIRKFIYDIRKSNFWFGFFFRRKSLVE